MTVSMRSTLAAGLVAVTMSAVAVVPVAHPQAAAITLPSIQLSASVLPLTQPAAAAAGAVLGQNSPRPAAAAALPALPAPVAISATGSAGDTIINAYNAIEPWAQWGFEVAAWAVSYLPWPLGWLGQQINIAYNTGEPLVQAVVYSFAYLIDGQVDLIGPTLMSGINSAVTNLVTGEIAWVLSFLPPLPPISFPVLPGASVAARAAAVTGPIAARTRSAQATVSINPVSTNPVSTNPVATNPVSTNPVSTNPVAINPVTSNPVADTPAADPQVADTSGGGTPADETPVAVTNADQVSTQSPATEAPRGRRGVDRSAIRAQPPTAVSDSPSDSAAATNGLTTVTEPPVASTAKETHRASRAAASRSAHPAQ